MGFKNIQDVSILAGMAPVYGAAANDDYITPSESDDKLLVHIKNTDTASHTLTIDDVNSTSPPGATSFDADVAVEVPAGEERMVELGQLHRFINESGEVHFNWSAITSVTVGVFRLR